MSKNLVDNLFKSHHYTQNPTHRRFRNGGLSMGPGRHERVKRSAHRQNLIGSFIDLSLLANTRRL